MDADDPRFPTDDPSHRPDAGDRLPLLTVEEAVCFPGTRMEVPLTDRGALRLVRELMQRPEGQRRAGVVLPMPDGDADPFGRPEVFPGGTVAQVLDLVHPGPEEGDGEDALEALSDAERAALEELDDPDLEARILEELTGSRRDGTPRVVLAGEYRFEVARQIPSARPFREVVARPLEDVPVDEADPSVVRLRQRILDLAAEVLPELREMVAFDAETLALLRSGQHRFEQVVNRLAAGLDLPPPRKLELLLANLAERGHALATILESRRSVLDRLRPWRHLSHDPELN